MKAVKFLTNFGFLRHVMGVKIIFAPCGFKGWYDSEVLGMLDVGSASLLRLREAGRLTHSPTDHEKATPSLRKHSQFQASLFPTAVFP